jgi:hypothetical protein
MKEKITVEDKSLEEALAFCLEGLRHGKLSLQGCLERFPQHQAELEPLLRKSIAIHSIADITPGPEFKTRGYNQLMEYLATHQFVTHQQPIRNIHYKSKPKLRWRFNMLQIIVVLVLILSGITGGVTYASDAAKPGDLLYGFDRAIEHVRLFLSPDEEETVRLHLLFAAERLDEAQKRLAEGDFVHAQIALADYAKAVSYLAKLVVSEKNTLAEWVIAELIKHQALLDELYEIAPDEVYEAIQDLIGVLENLKPPVVEPPAEVPPVEVPPVEVPPAEVPPVEVPPVEVPPVEVPPIEAPPVEVPPVEIPPVEVPPVEVPPVEIPPVEVPPTEAPPTEVSPVEVPPFEVPPIEVPPVEESPVPSIP